MPQTLTHHPEKIGHMMEKVEKLADELYAEVSPEAQNEAILLFRDRILKKRMKKINELETEVSDLKKTLPQLP